MKNLKILVIIAVSLLAARIVSKYSAVTVEWAGEKMLNGMHDTSNEDTFAQSEAEYFFLLAALLVLANWFVIGGTAFGSFCLLMHLTTNKTCKTSKQQESCSRM